MEIYACVYFPDTSSVLSASKPWKTNPCPAALTERAAVRGEGSKEAPNTVVRFEQVMLLLA